MIRTNEGNFCVNVYFSFFDYLRYWAPPPLIIINFGFPVYTDLWKTGLFERMSMQTDEDEHSIEMHLPYTAKAMER